jgi:hypothetical protein
MDRWKNGGIERDGKMVSWKNGEIKIWRER